MFAKKSLIVMLLTVILLTACVPQPATAPSKPTEAQASPTATTAPVVESAQAKPINLRLAIADAQGRPSEPYVTEFIDQVRTRSGGSILIEPVWDAGADTIPPFEQGVVKLVKDGEYDLGMAASRAWDSLGVTSFQALQAPFLITNDDLAKAVATSDIAERMLDGLSSSGFAGLTIWPEDLRHPFSVVPGKSILSPADFAGLTVRVIGSEVTNQLIEKLGGERLEGDGDYQAAESGLRQGASLTGTPTATGNVIFFPKFQVLFANAAAFNKLSDVQQTILREAAAATQKKAIADHPSDVENGKAWCEDGGTIVMASSEQVAAFEKAAQPVFESIEKDPANKEHIAAIRDLKAKTSASPGATACGPAVTAEVWSPGLPPNGVWRVELSVDDLVQMGLTASMAEKEWAGVYTWTYQDGKVEFHFKGGYETSCKADMGVVDNFVRATYTSGSDCQGGVDDFQWRLEGDGLHLHLVAIQNAPFLPNKAFYEAKPWQKMPADTEVWSMGLPPNGVWQVDLSTDDFLQMGVLKSTAEADWAGGYTLALYDGHLDFVYHSLNGGVGKCQATYEVVENFVRIHYYPVGDQCTPAHTEDVQWRVDDQGLHLRMINLEPGTHLESRAFYEAKPWRRIPNSGHWAYHPTVAGRLSSL